MFAESTARNVSTEVSASDFVAIGSSANAAIESAAKEKPTTSAPAAFQEITPRRNEMLGHHCLP
jgi:hypothetical protein